jgi:cytochrome c6
MNLTFYLFSTFFFVPLEYGEKVFFQNCAVCHPTGKNLILPEKNLKKESLETNGMNSKSALIYQFRNGKNSMPAFGDRLTVKQMEKIAEYVLFESEKNFENQ